MHGPIRLLICMVMISAVAGACQYHATPSVTAQDSVANLVERQERQMRTAVLLALIPIVVSFSFIFFIFYRNKREAYFKQTETELKLSIAEVEIKALRAQINPHFIFNCLNSVHHYMHKNDIKLAGEYLVKFSQLIRYVLETSSSRMVSLADDLNALELYIQLEQLRMDRNFDFEIVTDTSLNPDTIHIPPMMLQPFVENSIWHGLNHRGPGGRIRIEITPANDMLKCVIEDNGRRGSGHDKHDLSLTIKKTSLGMALINDRLAVVSRIYKVNAGFTLTDIMDDQQQEQGKRVELLLPFED